MVFYERITCITAGTVHTTTFDTIVELLGWSKKLISELVQREDFDLLPRYLTRALGLTQTEMLFP